MEKSVSSGIRDLHRWEVGSAGTLVEKSIRKQIFYENVFVLVNVFVTIFAGIAFAIPDETDKDFFLVLVVFERFFPIFEGVLTVLYRLSYLILTTIIIAPFHMIVYYYGHTRVQFTLFVKYLENLNDNVDPLKAVYDEEYQKEVTRRLKFCIDRHIHLYW